MPAPFTQPERGFTLIETVATILLMSVVATTLVTLNGNLFKGQPLLRQWQDSTPLLQACAERILTMRRASGFSTAPAFDRACDDFIGSDRFLVTVSPNSTSASCPSQAQCQLVRIEVNNGQHWMGPVVLQFMNDAP